MSLMALRGRLLCAAARAPWSQQQVLALSSSAARSAGEKADGYVHPVYFKIKETQQQYQIDNGLRVSAGS